MAGPAVHDNPELDVIELRLPDEGLQIDKFIEYSYNENFFTPSDGWRFLLAGEQIPSAVDKVLVPGTRVQLFINGHLQSSGAIAAVDRRNGRDGGTEIDIEGRDIFGPLVDGHVDPNLRFSEGQTLFEVCNAVFSSFGIESFSADNYANLNVITGQVKGAPSKRRKLKQFTVHQLHPYENEGAYSFLSRILNRFGMYLWPDAAGEMAIIGKVDGMADDGTYTLPAARYSLVRKRDSRTNNILEGGVRRDGANQPSVILARGDGGGGEFAKATLRSALVNPAITTDLSAIQAAYPKLAFKTLNVPAIVPYADRHARPLYVKDDESKTQEQLDAYCRMQMSTLLRQHLVGHYTIKGHSIGGSPVAVDSILNVDDDRAKYQGPMWVEARTFTKSAQAGSRTELALCLPGTVVL